MFTIAASGAKDSSMGCFYQRKATHWPVRDFTLTGFKKSSNEANPVILEASLPRWDVSVNGSALADRGWALQEHMMASRTMFWTEDGLFWQCGELCASEYESEVQPVNDIGTGEIILQIDALVNAIEHNPIVFSGSRTTWMQVVQEISIRSFTVMTDKLPAVSGLGHEVARMTGKFLMGIWKHNTVEELAWNVNW
ncbi:hypothetical protein FKW77_002640 [Venturia effusa]|uniref:Heterokaryon incompatibility domain-containing protein n=1 Tax=Venturia effusa TaxID=50376 RepID=A0A517LL08_9PEZI|nr:hypothetical protein FKW77_002640 [Venturia effusa]